MKSRRKSNLSCFMLSDNIKNLVWQFLHFLCLDDCKSYFFNVFPATDKVLESYFSRYFWIQAYCCPSVHVDSHSVGWAKNVKFSCLQLSFCLLTDQNCHGQSAIGHNSLTQVLVKTNNCFSDKAVLIKHQKKLKFPNGNTPCFFSLTRIGEDRIGEE